MKKLLTLVFAVAMLAFVGSAVAAEGDFEMSGHINSGFGFQYQTATANSGLVGGLFQEGFVPARGAADRANFIFFVDEVEVDVTKTFGENIRLRADLDFGDANLSSPNARRYGLAASLIEQAYITFNIPAGYGIETMFGRFNAPIGFEAVDINENNLPMHSMLYDYLRPKNLTGLKIYYPFSDLVDLHFYIVNNLADVWYTAKETPMPSFGLRLGFSWGEEGQESTIGISGAGGPEIAQGVGAAANSGKLGRWTVLGDLDFNVWVTDALAIGGEGLYRRDYSPAGVSAAQFFSGLLNLNYVFSDVWDGTLQYCYVKDHNGAVLNEVNGYLFNPTPLHVTGAGAAVTGAQAQYHEVGLGLSYAITDGAKLQTEYRFDMALVNGGGAKGMAHTLAANFAYEF